MKRWYGKYIADDVSHFPFIPGVVGWWVGGGHGEEVEKALLAALLLGVGSRACVVTCS